MADYTKDQQSARLDIAAAGLVCQLDRAGDTIDVPALLTEFSRSEIGFANNDGDIILPSDRKAIIPGGLERNPNKQLDKFVIPPCELYPDGADNVRIVDAVPLAPNGQVIIWTLQLRK